ncbi:MAG: DUF3226 domain-containing protein [Campylobacterota bacterium]|nr:DUF3226 domain-containing protein [Campylobacterota bacterium]
MKKYILVEGITDVAFVKYVCLKNGITQKFDDFKQAKKVYNCNDLYIINLDGQTNLEKELNLLKPKEIEISQIFIIQDADDNFETSTENIKSAIKNSEIDSEIIKTFLTPNNKDLGDLETLLLSTIKTNNIVECFNDYKKCLVFKQEVHPKALNKGQVYAYTMYSQKGENLHKPQDSFMYKKENEFIDTNLWDLSKDEFQPIIKFILNIFGEKR